MNNFQRNWPKVRKQRQTPQYEVLNIENAIVTERERTTLREGESNGIVYNVESRRNCLNIRWRQRVHKIYEFVTLEFYILCI